MPAETAVQGTRAAAAGGRRLLAIDNRFLPPLLITSILLAAHLSFGILESYERTALAIATAIGAERVMGRITYGKWPHPASAYITGISVGILIRSPAFWPFALVSAVSITSKYVIRWKGRHLWNPSNFAIVMVLLFSHGSASVAPGSQWGADYRIALVILGLGLLMMRRVNRLDLALAWLCGYIFMGLLRMAAGQGGLVFVLGPITGAEFALFTFSMMPDPKASPPTRHGARQPFERQAVLAHVERREMGVLRDEIAQLLQEDRSLPLLRGAEDLELPLEVLDLALRVLRLVHLRRTRGQLVAELAAEELVLDEGAAAPHEQQHAGHDE